jgi:predicted N-acetyltransferase YhbS
MSIDIEPIRWGHPLWEEVASFADACSWKAGPSLARHIRANDFAAWERVIVAIDHDEIVGYCTITAHDEMPPDSGYTPFIGYVFVRETHRGQRISGLMIEAACEYARGLGYRTVYIMSGEIGLYEKYGFEKLGDFPTIHDTIDQLFRKDIA